MGMTQMLEGKMLISALVKPNFDPAPVADQSGESFTTNLEKCETGWQR